MNTNNSKNDDWWDYYSDQPYVLTGNRKTRLTVDCITESIKILTTLIGLSPALLWRYFTLPLKPSSVAIEDFVGLSISPNPQYHNQMIDMIEELGTKQLLIRVPTWNTQYLDKVIELTKNLADKNIIINILQNRQSVIQPDQWQEDVRKIISQCLPFTDTFQIGNAINRSKWGCHSTHDYFLIQNKVEELRDDFPTIKLLGSSVIDFEPTATLRTLINFQPYHLDATAAQLYVNRRLSPYNKQFGIFDLEKKIRLIYSILSLSNRCDKKLMITETNWPLLNTKPYTPNSGNPRSTVDEQTQAEFLQQYYLIAYQTGMVDRVYWWQLINPGYGLVDSSGRSLRKMPSYFSLKAICDGTFALN